MARSSRKRAAGPPPRLRRQLLSSLESLEARSLSPLLCASGSGASVSIVLFDVSWELMQLPSPEAILPTRPTISLSGSAWVRRGLFRSDLEDQKFLREFYTMPDLEGPGGWCARKGS